ncbi:hypothetical protein SAMD00019534_014370 [Acytostelium subglobosum LB1]|uniref:hypothetical protein n=1 Tax=Acytostelium subglobosum LB1 TaxID=1410327 RepID=UPI000644AB0C|nr:hypothetical protein SAMD00019534_014370 [Acytostelium subglobosum LB1]GAM18262.1 hypothetical protein SAMD00019534_014370 [Acytostelium subglobosum LB1]|eukprot:XP_012758858.1 hypothetical protein SAMD00019534_014370 [Acytostelium subglobosum LB1]
MTLDLLLQTTKQCSLEWNVSLALISKSMFKFISTKMFTEVIFVEQSTFVVDYVEAFHHIINSHCVIKTPSKLVIEGHGFDMLCDMHRNANTAHSLNLSRLLNLHQIAVDRSKNSPKLSSMRELQAKCLMHQREWDKFEFKPLWLKQRLY